MADPIIDIPGACNVVMYGGRSFVRTWTLYEDDGVTPIDLTGFTGSALVKTSPTVADASAVLTFTTTTGSTMTLGDAAGTIRIAQTKTVTAALQVTAGHVDTEYYWDLQVSDATGISSPVLDGKFTLIVQETR